MDNAAERFIKFEKKILAGLNKYTNDIENLYRIILSATLIVLFIITILFVVNLEPVRIWLNAHRLCAFCFPSRACNGKREYDKQYIAEIAENLEKGNPYPVEQGLYAVANTTPSLIATSK